MLEFQSFQDKIRSELRARMKFSRDLLELRDKEAKLVKVKRYEEAEKIKMKADLLEEFERNKLEAEVSTLPLYSLPLDANSIAEEGGQVAPCTATCTCCVAQTYPARQERAIETSLVGLTTPDSTQQEYSK